MSCGQRSPLFSEGYFIAILCHNTNNCVVTIFSSGHCVHSIIILFVLRNYLSVYLTVFVIVVLVLKVVRSLIAVDALESLTQLSA